MALMLSDKKKQSKHEVKTIEMKKFRRKSGIKPLEHFINLPANMTRSFYMPLWLYLFIVMVDQARKLPKECKPISNTEVIKIIKTHYAKKAKEDIQMGMHSMNLNESGNELRKQTMDYI